MEPDRTPSRLGSLALAFASLLVVALLCEGGLRAVGFAYSPYQDEFEITPEYRIFERDGDDYVTRARKLASFREQRFPAERTPGELRVVLLGGSSVYNLGSAERLRARIAAARPDVPRITLINVGGNAYGSDRLRLHFHEVLEYEPDVVVLYSGHNEFNERFLRETLYQRNALSGVDDLLIRYSRAYQALARGIHLAVQANVEAIAEDRHPLFPPDFKGLQWDKPADKSAIYANYEANLDAMASLAAAAGVPLVLSTVSYNRRAHPYRPPNDAFKACLKLLRRDRTGFRLCAELAIDADLQPIRATQTTNAIVRRVAERNGLPLADVDARILREAPGGLPDFSLFADHCHLNERGNEILEDVLFETLLAHGLLEPR